MKKRGERGPSAHNVGLLEKATAIISHGKPMTVRGVCYKLFVVGAIPSMERTETAKVSRLLVYAREHGHVNWADIVDESRQIERLSNWHNLEDFARTIQRAYRRDYWASQPYNLQVWSEKSTVAGVLRPVLDTWGVPFMAVHGFGSATAMHDLAIESADDQRTTIILYVGDHDPSGMCMSEVDMPNRIAQYGGRVLIRRVALAASDVRALPDFAAKPTDPRFRWYVERYGPRAWELDAMDENDVRARVSSEIQRYIDQDAWERTRLVEAAEQATVRQVAAAMGR